MPIAHLNPSRRHCMAAALSLAAIGPLSALAQSDYPQKPIRIIVGYPPGGSVDMAARVLADVLSARLQATVVVENLSGAAGTVAAQKVVNSPADGYTLLAGSSNEMAATGQVNPTQKYDPLRDLTSIGLLATAPVMLVASPKVGIKSLTEFIALVRKNPGRYSYGSSGVGSTLHFAGELVKQRAGLFMTHIPYRGTAPLTTDLIGGAIEFAMMSPTAAAPFLQSGRLIGLGITSAQRFPGAPDVPALSEHPSLKGYEMVGWFAMAAPKGLPPVIAQRLRSALQEGLKDPAIRKRLQEGGAIPAVGQEDITAVMREDIARYASLVKFANVTP
jgi:tripartite-type tricarboxylate transporter receptor subunit TctC